MADQQTEAPGDPVDRVDAAAYAAHLDRLDRLGREALAADPAQAIELVREANELVTTLLPMHRRLMEELEHHRASLQAACEELVGADDRDRPVDDDPGPADEAAEAADPAAARLSRLAALDDGDGDDVPF